MAIPPAKMFCQRAGRAETLPEPDRCPAQPGVTAHRWPELQQRKAPGLETMSIGTKQGCLRAKESWRGRLTLREHHKKNYLKSLYPGSKEELAGGYLSGEYIIEVERKSHLSCKEKEPYLTEKEPNERLRRQDGHDDMSVAGFPPTELTPAWSHPLTLCA